MCSPTPSTATNGGSTGSTSESTTSTGSTSASTTDSVQLNDKNLVFSSQLEDESILKGAWSKTFFDDIDGYRIYTEIAGAHAAGNKNSNVSVQSVKCLNCCWSTQHLHHDHSCLWSRSPGTSSLTRRSYQGSRSKEDISKLAINFSTRVKPAKITMSQSTNSRRGITVSGISLACWRRFESRLFGCPGSTRGIPTSHLAEEENAKS